MNTPVRKFSAAAIGGAAAVVFTEGIGMVYPEVKFTGPMVAALTTLATFAASLLIPDAMEKDE